MRILAIRGCNLTSLAGAFEVELDKGALHASGVFAITGPVGAGKTTLLDALCLALYNRTPRFSQSGGVLVGRADEDQKLRLRSNDVRSVLRRGTSSGHAEVDFIGSDGVVYRARWSVRRARGRIDGVVQQQSIELRERETGRQFGGTNTEVLTEIQQRIGLSFDQFCRSALLAQGEFARFLKADDRDRAELLERMTGTELYGRLSIAAFQKRKDEQAELDGLRQRLEDRKLLPDEERAALVAERDTLNSQHAQLEGEAKIAEQAARWHRDLQRMQKEVARSEAELQRAQADAASIAREGIEKQATFRVKLKRQIETVTAQRDACRESLQTTRRWLDEHRHEAQLSQQWERWSSVLARYGDSAKESTRIEAGRIGMAAQLVKARAVHAAALTAQKRESAAFTAAEAACAEAVGTDGRSALGQQLQEVEGHLERLRKTESTIEAIAAAEAAEVKCRDKAAQAEAAAGTAAAACAQCEAELLILTARREEAERALRDAERFMSLAQHRAELVDGEPCPLCGAVEHPFGHDADEGIDANLRPRVVELRAAEKEVRERLAIAGRDRATQTQLTRERRDEAKALRAERAQKSKMLPTGKHDATSVAAEKQQWIARRDAVLAEQKRIDALRAEVERCRKNLQVAHDDTIAADRGERAVASEIEKLEQALRHEEAVRGRAVAELEQVFDVMGEMGEMGAIDAAHQPAWRDRLAVDPPAFLAASQRAALDFSRHGEQLETLTTREAALTRLLDALLELQGEAGEKVFDTALGCLGQVGLADTAALAELLQREVRRLEIERRKGTELSARIQSTEAVLLEHRRLQREHEDRDRPKIDAVRASERLATARSQLEALKPRRDEVLYELRKDDETRAEVKKLEPVIEAKRKRFATWDELNDLIGSFDGRSFRIYAQSLTLDCLLASTNHHLQDLAPRYRLQRVPGYDLDLQVVDLDMGEEVRSVNSLSGGESFLLSLALALGLSSISAASTRVESLFIDEGFGGLDPQTLDTALATLDALQATGRQVGLISHVPGIAERIGAQVRVAPMGSGRSEVLVMDGG